MAKAFTSIKSVALSPQSKLTFGKYKDCRVCDVWDDYEYFLWLVKENPGLFSQACKDFFLCAKHENDARIYQAEEVDPYLLEDVPY